ncbi:hypothetical protein VB005_01099, partial [Metarhizium brunneum]
SGQQRVRRGTSDIERQKKEAQFQKWQDTQQAMQEAATSNE